jgi:hypothetical protein
MEIEALLLLKFVYYLLRLILEDFSIYSPLILNTYLLIKDSRFNKQSSGVYMLFSTKELYLSLIAASYISYYKEFIASSRVRGSNSLYKFA